MAGYDRASELKAFDDTRTGVKGLVDAGATKIPRIFIHPHLRPPVPTTTRTSSFPIINLSNPRRLDVVGQLRAAAETFGMFQVADHGIPMKVLDEMLQGVRNFHEQDSEVKKDHYSRDPSRKVFFNSNFDLYQSPAANWRDSLVCLMAPEPPSPEQLPLACRDIIIQYSNHMQRLGGILFELLSEALGLNPEHLIEMECAKGHSLTCHYYPPCPEPHLTLGTTRHSDPGFLTILLQDHIGGLQILHEDQWINVPSVPGALVVNIGDLLQLISNDKLKSVEHRVLASKIGPRISVATFFSTRHFPSSRLYGPIKELASDDNPPMYKDILVSDFFTYYMSKGLDGRCALDNFKL